MRKFTKLELMNQKFYSRFRRGEGIISEIDWHNSDQSILLEKNKVYHVSECDYDHEYGQEFVKLVEIGPAHLFALDHFEPSEPSFGMVMGSKIITLIEIDQDK